MNKNKLWVVYDSSSHEEKTNVYLTQISKNNLKRISI